MLGGGGGQTYKDSTAPTNHLTGSHQPFCDFLCIALPLAFFIVSPLIDTHGSKPPTPPIKRQSEKGKTI